MQGTRVYSNPAGFLDHNAIRQPGAYGRATFDYVKKYGAHAVRHNWWNVTCPDGSGCVLNPDVHSVTVMENGTITVYPSIVTSTWHGWLECGVWRSV